jgi:iron complex outermembrane receptor protein
VTDIDKLKPSYTNMLELGYKGSVGQRFFVAVDGWYQRHDNFTTAAQNFTPNALMDGQTLAAGLASYLAPVLGPSATAVATAVATSMAKIPVGTVVPNSNVTTNGDIAFTYKSIDKSINLHGLDVGLDYTLSSALSVHGTYSWMSDTEFDIEPGQPALTLNSPNHKASLAFEFTDAPSNVSAELRGRYQNTFKVNSAVFVSGTNLTAPDGSIYQYQQPPTATFVDALVSWKLPASMISGASISLSATNLLDNKVPMFAGVPSIGRLVMTRMQVTF